jgi:regulation of enolase protein 1 (concanavalin A-like superfamily)
MFRKIIDKIKQRKKNKFYKEGFIVGSNDILIFLSDDSVITKFNTSVEVMDRMYGYMISYQDAGLKCRSNNPEMIKAFMSGYNNAAVKMGIVIKQNMSE